MAHGPTEIEQVQLGNMGKGSENSHGKSNSCTTIQDGTLSASTGETLSTGYDEYGYNYQAYMFNGRYCNYDRKMGGEDCDGDGLLDRHYGYDSYIGSGAWLTNHQSGTYIGEDGKS